MCFEQEREGRSGMGCLYTPFQNGRRTVGIEGILVHARWCVSETGKNMKTHR